MDTKFLQAPLRLKSNGEAGAVTAVISTFDRVDKDGDIVRASAFTHGQEVPMTFAHNWQNIVGRGKILVEPTRAVFDGVFFLDTAAGAEAYKVVKNLANLLEWSWGFLVEDASHESVNGQSVRVIKKARVLEVSPVLVGAGEGTMTLAIKHGLVAPHHEPDVLLGGVRALCHEYRQASTLHRKEGRQLSAANRTRLSAFREALQSVLQEVDDLLAATDPNSEQAKARLLFAEVRRTLDRSERVLRLGEGAALARVGAVRG